MWWELCSRSEDLKSNVRTSGGEARAAHSQHPSSSLATWQGCQSPCDHCLEAAHGLIHGPIVLHVHKGVQELVPQVLHLCCAQDAARACKPTPSPLSQPQRLAQAKSSNAPCHVLPTSVQQANIDSWMKLQYR